MASLIQSAREGTDVKFLYFQNNAEWIQFLEKFSQAFNKEYTEISIESLWKIIEHQNFEGVQAVFHDQSYTLSQLCSKFCVKFSVTFLVWSKTQRSREKFPQYVRSFSKAFLKPSNAGRKPGQHRCIWLDQSERDILIIRHEIYCKRCWWRKPSNSFFGRRN